MSIFDPAKIALNNSIVDAMPEWKKGERMNEKKLTEVERLRAVNAQLLEALEMWVGAFGSGSFTSQTRTAQQFRADLWEKTNAALSAPAPKLKLRPMSEAPRDKPFLAYTKYIGDIPNVCYWMNDWGKWVTGMRTFTPEQFLAEYVGYLPLPEVGL